MKEKKKKKNFPKAKFSHKEFIKHMGRLTNKTSHTHKGIKKKKKKKIASKHPKSWIENTVISSKHPNHSFD
jgi:hypothetical protein